MARRSQFNHRSRGREQTGPATEDRPVLAALEELLDSSATPERKSEAAGRFLEALAGRDLVGLLCLMHAVLDALSWCAEREGLHEVVARVDDIGRLLQTHARSALPTVQ
jgi:hypothetical protein